MAGLEPRGRHHHLGRAVILVVLGWAAAHLGWGVLGRRPAHQLADVFRLDATTDGRPIKVVSVVDEHTRECVVGLVERRVSGEDFIDELDRLAAVRGYPGVLRGDNGPELVCAATADWAGERVGLHFIPPGEPWRNGYLESFNAWLRDECLNINIFWSLAQARVVISEWKEDYNHRRRHVARSAAGPPRASLASRC